MKSSIPKIVSGGQTGADQAALDWAIRNDIPHGGWCPKGRRSEDGTIPECYNVQELERTSYLYRTERNIIDSDGTVILSIKSTLTGGSKRTASTGVEVVGSDRFESGRWIGGGGDGTRREVTASRCYLALGER